MDISQYFTQYWSICFTEIQNDFVSNKFDDVSQYFTLFFNIFHCPAFKLPVRAGLKFPQAAGNPSLSPVSLRAVQVRAQSHFQNSHKLLNCLFASVRT